MTEIKKKATKKEVAGTNVGGETPQKRTRIKSEKSDVAENTSENAPESEEAGVTLIKATAADYGFAAKERETKKASEAYVDADAEGEVQVKTKTERRSPVAVEEFDWDRFESD